MLFRFMHGATAWGAYEPSWESSVTLDPIDLAKFLCKMHPLADKFFMPALKDFTKRETYSHALSAVEDLERREHFLKLMYFALELPELPMKLIISDLNNITMDHITTFATWMHFKRYWTTTPS